MNEKCKIRCSVPFVRTHKGRSASAVSGRGKKNIRVESGDELAAGSVILGLQCLREYSLREEHGAERGGDTRIFEFPKESSECESFSFVRTERESMWRNTRAQRRRRLLFGLWRRHTYTHTHAHTNKKLIRSARAS